MRTPALLSLLAGTAAVVLTLAAPARAAYWKLDTPGVALPESYPAAARAQVQRALKRTDCKFLEGHALNSFTSLFYGGETRALNLFLGDLAKCPGMSVQVSLKRLGEGLDWRVSHSAFGEGFHVEVNLDSKKINVEDLYIPSAKGPEIKK